MSDFSNYIRVAIQGLSENTPLARAAAYERVRKGIRRQLESRSASEAETNETLEDLENAILDLEAEQLLNPVSVAKPADPKPADTGPKEPAPQFEIESNVTPIMRKASEQPAREAASAPKPVDVPLPDPAPSRPEKSTEPPRELKPAPRFSGSTAETPAPAAPPSPQYTPQRNSAVGGSAGQALKVEPGEPDPLEEFQSALTAELALPITKTEKADVEPLPEKAEELEIAPPPAEEPPAPIVATESDELLAETGFDVKRLLRNAVDSEDMRDPATREIIYRRARNALVRHLKSLSPQPDFDTVHAHIERLNAAIREVEAEQAEKSFGIDNADTGPSTDELMSELEDIWSADFEQEAAEEAAPRRAPEPQPVRAAKPEAPRAAAPVRPTPSDLERTIADEVDEAIQELSEPDMPRRKHVVDAEPEPFPARSIDEEVEDAVEELIAADTARHQVQRNQPPRKSSRTRTRPVPPPPSLEELDFETEETAATAELEDEIWEIDEPFDFSDDMFAEEFDVEEPATPVAAEKPRAARPQPLPRRRRRFGFGRLLAILLILLVGAGIAVAFAFPDATSRYSAQARTAGAWMFELVAGLAGESTQPAVEPEASEESVAQNSEPVVEQTEPPVEASAPAPAEPEMAPAPPPAPETAIAPPEGEKAFLFPTAGGQQPLVAGNVSWSVINSAPFPGAPAEPAVRAQATIPSDGLRATLTLRRNLDTTLPASHLLEIVFVPADGVGGSEISSVENVTFVQSGQDRAEPLVGSMVKIADNIFLLALADVPAARQLHDRLLGDPDLIEIRFAHLSGRRSTLRLVTGETGGAAFANAVEAWSETTAAEIAPAPEPASEPAPAPAPAPQAVQPEPEPVQPEPQSAQESIPLVQPAEPFAEAPEDTAAAPEGETPAEEEAEPGRPTIPDVVPIPPDRPLFNG